MAGEAELRFLFESRRSWKHSAWPHKAQTAVCAWPATETSRGPTDNVKYTGQDFESDGQVYARRPSFFFSSEIGHTRCSYHVFDQHRWPSGEGLHSDTLRATTSHRRAAETYLQHDTQAGRDWPVYVRYRRCPSGEVKEVS